MTPAAFGAPCLSRGSVLLYDQNEDKRHTLGVHCGMKLFRWAVEKNEMLKEARGVSFESIVVAIELGGLLDILEHPNKTRYPNQRVLVVSFDGYVYLVPFVEEAEYFFLKTVIPSRKATRDYLKQGDPDGKN